MIENSNGELEVYRFSSDPDCEWLEQDGIRVSHKQGGDDLVRLGRDLEKIVLSRAIYWHLQ